MFWVAPDVQKRAGYSIWTVKLERSPLPDIWAISSGATHSWQMWEICCSLAPGTSPATSSTHSPPSLHPLHFFIASLWLIFFCKGKSRKEVWSVEVCLLLVRRWVAEDACTALHLSLQNDFSPYNQIQTSARKLEKNVTCVYSQQYCINLARDDSSNKNPQNLINNLFGKYLAIQQNISINKFQINSDCNVLAICLIIRWQLIANLCKFVWEWIQSVCDCLQTDCLPPRNLCNHITNERGPLELRGVAYCWSLQVLECKITRQLCFSPIHLSSSSVFFSVKVFSCIHSFYVSVLDSWHLIANF